MHRFPAVVVSIGVFVFSVVPQGSAEAEGRLGRRGPPPEAIAACDGASQDAACSFITPRGHEIEGSCRQLPDQLVCAPDRGRRGRRGEPSDEDVAQE